MRSQSFIDSSYRPCMECNRPGKPKPVMPGLGFGVEVRRKDNGNLVGYLHANCKDAWVSKHGEANYSFQPF